MKISYEEALMELQEIVNGLENETIGIDDLSKKMKRAKQLIKHCKTKLHKTEVDLKGLNEEDE